MTIPSMKIALCVAMVVIPPLRPERQNIQELCGNRTYSLRVFSALLARRGSLKFFSMIVKSMFTETWNGACRSFNDYGELISEGTGARRALYRMTCDRGMPARNVDTAVIRKFISNRTPLPLSNISSNQNARVDAIITQFVGDTLCTCHTFFR